MDYNTFIGNFAAGKESMGGAIQIYGDELTASGFARFSNNRAVKGGGISLIDTYAEFRAGNFTFKTIQQKELVVVCMLNGCHHYGTLVSRRQLL